MDYLIWDIFWHQREALTYPGPEYIGDNGLFYFKRKR